MSFNRPEPGAQLNFGEPTVPRPAAAVILVHGGDRELELLLARRGSATRLMAGAWVFPGGAVDPADGVGQEGLRTAARRELREETGIVLPPELRLTPFARWITPKQVHRRYDTWFYIAAAPERAKPESDGVEIVDHIWTTPAAALADQAAGRLQLVFPTIKQLQRLAGFRSVADLLAATDAQQVEPIEPRIVRTDGGELEVLLPGEPGYAD